jgi:hypothetical protein
MKKFKLRWTVTYEFSEAEVLNFSRQKKNDDSIQAEDLTESDYFEYADFLAYDIDFADWEIVDSWEE